MFTGLVETLGVLRRRAGSPVARAVFEADLGALVLGESVSVHGACLTVDRIVEGGFEADLSSETRARTTLGDLPIGARVHLERATPVGGRLGGHVVLGHVDGIGEIVARQTVGEAVRLEVRAPAALARFVAEKGSIALNGVSLTLNEVGRPAGPGVTFAVMLVPHTLGRTTLCDERVGSRLNIEVDVLARYVARQLEFAPGPLARPVEFAPGPLARPDEIDGISGGLEESGESRDRRILDKLRAGGFA